MTTEVADLVRRHIADVFRRAIAAPAPAAAAVREKRPRKRSADGKALQAKLLTVIGAAKKGASLADVIKRSGIERGAVKYHLRSLRRQKKAKVTGTRRTARWLVA